MKSLVKLLLVGSLVAVSANARVLNIGDRKIYIHTKKVWDYDTDQIKFIIEDGKLILSDKDIPINGKTVKFGGDCKVDRKKIGWITWGMSSDTGCLPEYASMKKYMKGQLGSGGNFHILTAGDWGKGCKDKVTTLKVTYRGWSPMKPRKLLKECKYTFRLYPL